MRDDRFDPPDSLGSFRYLLRDDLCRDSDIHSCACLFFGQMKGEMSDDLALVSYRYTQLGMPGMGKVAESRKSRHGPIT